MKCREIIDRLEKLAPPSMACDWDNPGLLAGRADREVKTVFLAVDATDAAIDQAEEAGADMLLTHHPLIFKPLYKVNDQDFISRRIVRLIRDDISYYAMHTNFDSAPGCMGDLAGERLGLSDMQVLEKMGVTDQGIPYGIGVTGLLPGGMTLREIAEKTKQVFGLPFVSVFGDMDSDRKLERAAVCPGAGGSTADEAIRWGAQVYITGDVSHHGGIDALARNMAVIDAGHYGIEHIFTEFMEQYLKKELDGKIRICREKEAFPSRVI